MTVVAQAPQPAALPSLTTAGRALVLGDRGALGSLIAAAFERSGWEVLRGARRPAPERRARTVELGTPATLRRAMGGADLVVNTVSDTDLTAERLVLEHGGALVNPAPLPAGLVRGLRAASPEPLGTVLLNAGLAPGVTNLVAAELLARHPDADGIELVRTVSTRGTRGRLDAGLLHRHLTGQARHSTAIVPLPAPFGERRCLRFAESEGGWLGSPAGGREVRSYLCFAEPGVERLVLALNAARALRALPRAALGRTDGQASPRFPSRESVAHWVAALREERRLEALAIECQGDYAGAAATATIFAEALLGPSGPGPGVHLPEEAFTLDELAPRLWSAGIDIAEQQRKPY
jgi:hypothetical protein